MTNRPLHHEGVPDSEALAFELALAECLDEVESGGALPSVVAARYPQYPDLLELLNLAQAIRALSAPTAPSLAFPALDRPSTPDRDEPAFVEELAAALEAVDRPRDRTYQADSDREREIASLVELAQAIGSLPAPAAPSSLTYQQAIALRTGRGARRRRNLVAWLEQSVLSDDWLRGPAVRAAVVAAVMLLGSSLVVPSTYASVPGDALYPIKRLREQVELMVVLDDVRRTELRLAHISTRLAEAQADGVDPRTREMLYAEAFEATSAALESMDRLPEGVQLRAQSLADEVRQRWNGQGGQPAVPVSIVSVEADPWDGSAATTSSSDPVVSSAEPEPTATAEPAAQQPTRSSAAPALQLIAAAPTATPPPTAEPAEVTPRASAPEPSEQPPSQAQQDTEDPPAQVVQAAGPRTPAPPRRRTPAAVVSPRAPAPETPKVAGTEETPEQDSGAQRGAGTEADERPGAPQDPPVDEHASEDDSEQPAEATPKAKAAEAKDKAAEAKSKDKRLEGVPSGALADAEQGQPRQDSQQSGSNSPSDPPGQSGAGKGKASDAPGQSPGRDNKQEQSPSTEGDGTRGGNGQGSEQVKAREQSSESPTEKSDKPADGSKSDKATDSKKAAQAAPSAGADKTTPAQTAASTSGSGATESGNSGRGGGSSDSGKAGGKEVADKGSAAVKSGKKS